MTASSALGTAGRRGVAGLLSGLVRVYQLGVSRYTPPSCRFYPTCSHYGIEALRVHGPLKGPLLTVWRILRCNPWSRGGTDFVPAPGLWRNPTADPIPAPLEES